MTARSVLPRRLAVSRSTSIRSRGRPGAHRAARLRPRPRAARRLRDRRQTQITAWARRFVLGISLGNAVEVLDIEGDHDRRQDAQQRFRRSVNTNMALTTLGEIEPLVGASATTRCFTHHLAGGAPTNPLTPTSRHRRPSDRDDHQQDACPPADRPQRRAAGCRVVNADGTLGATVNISGQIVADAEPIQDPTRSVRLVLRARTPASTAST